VDSTGVDARSYLYQTAESLWRLYCLNGCATDVFYNDQRTSAVIWRCGKCGAVAGRTTSAGMWRDKWEKE
jgi:ribosomal protein L37AE/L43A